MMNFELWITDRRLRREAVGEGSEFCVLGSEFEIMNSELGMMKVASVSCKWRVREQKLSTQNTELRRDAGKRTRLEAISASNLVSQTSSCSPVPLILPVPQVSLFPRVPLVAYATLIPCFRHLPAPRPTNATRPAPKRITAGGSGTADMFTVPLISSFPNPFAKNT